MFDLILVGMGILLAGLLVLVLAASSGGSEGDRTRVRGGGVVMIGPIPIIFGSDARWASVAIVLAVVLILVALVAGLL
jgi:uncharacterized protein (TIGR00304 family)